MVKDYNNKPIKCKVCDSIDLYFYDGCLGYESVKCRKCGLDQQDTPPEQLKDLGSVIIGYIN